jgi:rhodanese-related sulfurtransferase
VEIPEVDVDTLARELEAGASLLDVRQLDEWEEGRVPGVPLVPLDQLVERVGEVSTASPLYVICKGGGRSLQACEFLRGQGIEAINVAGGTMAWISSGREVATGAE